MICYTALLIYRLLEKKLDQQGTHFTIEKNMLSDYIAQFNNWVFDAPQTFSGFENLAALFGYPVQIFLDFSGYSDMSIGVAAILGFYLPDNFYFPYRSLSVTEFWRRWHIFASVPSGRFCSQVSRSMRTKSGSSAPSVSFSSQRSAFIVFSRIA